MILYAVVAVLVGLGIGAGSMISTRRRAQTGEQAVRRQRLIQACLLGILAALLLFDAMDTPRHRYLNLALVAIAVTALLDEWLQGRRSKTP
ncbi:hypothetical protein [Mycobacterium avium]|uniref:hypothetical protein n=1 Tax=Mycobacterium avium TaxID=1764 RepID=UPI00079FF333|nr:hypothetical protein [Mycobacterium avium]